LSQMVLGQKLISLTDTASEGKIDSDAIDSKTDTASDGEV